MLYNLLYQSMLPWSCNDGHVRSVGSGQWRTCGKNIHPPGIGGPLHWLIGLSVQSTEYTDNKLMVATGMM